MHLHIHTEWIGHPIWKSFKYDVKWQRHVFITSTVRRINIMIVWAVSYERHTKFDHGLLHIDKTVNWKEEKVLFKWTCCRIIELNFVFFKKYTKLMALFWGIVFFFLSFINVNYSFVRSPVHRFFSSFINSLIHS